MNVGVLFLILAMLLTPAVDGVAPRACRRAGVDPSVLERWP